MRRNVRGNGERYDMVPTLQSLKIASCFETKQKIWTIFRCMMAKTSGCKDKIS